MITRSPSIKSFPGAQFAAPGAQFAEPGAQFATALKSVGPNLPPNRRGAQFDGAQFAVAQFA